jgi:hypothetical protein
VWRAARVREGEKKKARHLVVVVIVVTAASLAATHVSTCSADTHEALMGDSRSPFSDAQTH